ncbi:uncharacterized protein LOC142230289 [Haematobia irritans]|uniref:uncharacterized protein LOC142230289 n=1 Tax=Haematobia irritans TaxID=7368 RepID=UPI003F505F28
MIKYLFVLALVLVVTVEANSRCNRICRRDRPSRAICATDGRQQICHRMTQCKMDEENCHRRNANKPMLTNVPATRCRNIKSPNGQGPCARTRRPRSTPIDCSRLKCTNPSNKLSCYRCSHNLCQRLTPCQWQRVNCERGQSNRLSLVDHRHCAGMRRGERLQRCKALPKRG